MKKINLDKAVNLYGNELRIGTLLVAKGFNHDHKYIIGLIRKYQNIFEELSILKSESFKTKGQIGTEFFLTEEQAAFLGTLFRNNEQAVQFKKRLVKKFFIMKKALARIAIQRFDPDWKDARESGKPTRLKLTDVVKPLRLQAMEQNPDTTYRKQENLIYIHYTKVIYQTLFIFNMPLKKVRDMLSIDQIKDVDRLESLATALIVKLMFIKTHYKKIYQAVKEKARAYGEVIGKTDVPMFQIEHNQQKQLSIFGD